MAGPSPHDTPGIALPADGGSQDAVPTETGARRIAVLALRSCLDARASATSVLQDLCPTPIRIVHLPVTTPPTGDILEMLAVGRAQDVLIRHVRLMCGATALCDAWNWYVPSRLPPAANKLLTETDTPFGHAVREGWFRRHALTSHIPDAASGPVLQNRAILRRVSDDAPIALVQEDYTVAALGKLPRFVP